MLTLAGLAYPATISKASPVIDAQGGAAGTSIIYFNIVPRQCGRGLIIVPRLPSFHIENLFFSDLLLFFPFFFLPCCCSFVIRHGCQNNYLQHLLIESAGLVDSKACTTRKRNLAVKAIRLFVAKQMHNCQQLTCTQ